MSIALSRSNAKTILFPDFLRLLPIQSENAFENPRSIIYSTSHLKPKTNSLPKDRSFYQFELWQKQNLNNKLWHALKHIHSSRFQEKGEESLAKCTRVYVCSMPFNTKPISLVVIYHTRTRLWNKVAYLYSTAIQNMVEQNYTQQSVIFGTKDIISVVNVILLSFNLSGQKQEP